LLLGASTLEERQDSDVIAWLSRLPDTTPGVVYTNLYTPSDTVATPNSTSMLESSGGADVANVDIEETCGETISHFDLPGDPASAHLIYWGLNRGPGDVVPSVEDCGV
ncbi:MAG: triacylglycerol lipase, partial [Corynebacterium marinum]|nr:triacylglycerol lipase [Corynebacterium marinum]